MIGPKPGQLYEAIVHDIGPFEDHPGALIVRIPEVYGDDPCPDLVEPLWTGWSGGGWHGVPDLTLPSDEEGDVRVLVLKIGHGTWRWLGHSQGWSAVTDRPGTRSGARSGNGNSRVSLDNDLGILSAVKSEVDGYTDKSSYMWVGPTNNMTMQTADGVLIQLSDEKITILSPDGCAIAVGGGKITMLHADGVANMELRDGHVVNIGGNVIQMNAGTIQMGDGATPPTDGFILSTAFLTALNLVLVEVAAAAAASAVPSPNTAAMQTAIATSLSSGAPYLSTRIKGS